MTGKENNKNSYNTGSGGYKGNNNKKFVGRNESLYRKTFKINAQEALHQFIDKVKAIADYVGQKYTYGGDICFMVENMADYNF